MFTLVVMPDTQYLFDGDSIQQAPVQRAVEYVHRHARSENIRFVAHLGDLTQNGAEGEMAAFARAFAGLRHARVGYSTIAGNHDIDSDTDDGRGDTPYLRHFRRSSGRDGVVSVSPSGYCSAHTFTAGPWTWLVLALDWRLSEQTFAWASSVLRAHANCPTILVTHDLVQADDGRGIAEFSDYGRTLWDRLITQHDQIFLTLNGHFWPSGRTTQRNASGHDVHLHLANYQERYFGGGSMIRTYRFDLSRNVIDVETFSPWVQAQSAPNELMQQELTPTSEVDRFSVPLNFVERFADFAPVPQPAGRPAARCLVPGTVAYWRPDAVSGGRVRDLSGHGNDLEMTGSGADVAVAKSHHPQAPCHASWTFTGKRTSGRYFQTVADAPLNDATFDRGYTVEAFFELPTNWGDDNAWTSLLSRQGMSKSAHATGGDPEEPVMTLSLSGARELQWCVYPTSSTTSQSNWGHELRLGRWWHVAVVNDGRQTTMYVDGCPVARNPRTKNHGLTTLHRRVLVGGYEYADRLDKVFAGQIGEIRIVERALKPSEFLLATAR